MSCPFCPPPAPLVYEDELVVAFEDAYPVSPGHTLIVPKRHVETYFEATPEERAAIWSAVDAIKAKLDTAHRPDGYNVGFNAGVAAGQTVMHLHVHLIPRYRGDMDDPRGGVRHVIPSRGNYKRLHRPLATGGRADPFIKRLRPLIASADRVAIVAAFVQHTGVEQLEPEIDAALARGAAVRLLTGDYLEITQVQALEALLDWQSASQGAFVVRVVETEAGRAFHPKSYVFEGAQLGAVYVGSSNVSRSAFTTGVEWNLRVDRDTDAAAFDAAKSAYEDLWQTGVALTRAWIDAYAERARARPDALPPGEIDAEPLPKPHDPHEIQLDALAELEASRDAGKRRALAVLATGLGKTWLAAFDVDRVREQLGRPPRVLFLAHRREILRQAAKTFRILAADRWPPVPSVRMGWFVGALDDLDADVVFASVPKLTLEQHLARLTPDAFDYVVVDEVHHATAKSYRRILDRLDPHFMLGLTATPDRADAADVAGMFDDNIAYRADVGAGIESGRLVPFHYFGVADTVDYAPIPWRGGKFGPAELAEAVQTQRRMETLWDAWQAHPGDRTLVFCCSVDHADFAKRWLADKGVETRAVHSQPHSDDRDEAIEALGEGRIQALCSVDMFNEGLDVPRIDRVVMLRPTESPVLFLQQLGRGLRRADDKDALTIIDFVGNHRVFLDRLRNLLSFATDDPTSVRAFVEGEEPQLPDGCTVDVQLEAIDLLSKLLPKGGKAVERIYDELSAARGERPTAGELQRMGYLPSTLRPAHDGWFDFVRSKGDLNDDEKAALDRSKQWLRHLERTAMTKCYKAVVLEVLLEAGALGEGMRLAELAERSHRFLTRSPALIADVPEDLRTYDAKKWLAYWKKNPIAAWSNGKHFDVEGDRLVSRVPADEATAEMTRELVDYLLARYRQRTTADAERRSFECKVTHNQRDPILMLPSRDKHPWLPEGETYVRIPNGKMWAFKFVKIACNTARPVGARKNQLPDLLRGWFGPTAGQSGTNYRVRFEATPDGWWVDRADAEVISLDRHRVVAYPTLRAAAGAAEFGEQNVTPDEVHLPIRDAADRFAVRATGDSMDGGRRPIRDGDWVVMKWSRSRSAQEAEGRIALVQLPGDAGGVRFQLKRVVKDESGAWHLRSENPAYEDVPVDAEAIAVATLDEVVRPESIAPPVGTIVELDGDDFGLGEPIREGRVAGHLFVLANELAAPDRVERPIADRRPGETAFVLAKTDEGWRYCGVGRWTDDAWTIPDVDFTTWRALGTGRGASRRLDPRWLDEAKEIAASLEVGAWAELDGRRCRVVGLAAKGGVRIDGGPDGFAERTVSLLDIGWVLAAREDVRTNGGVLDEARVNKLRYLDGTPKGSTRWIDTGWALVIIAAARPAA